MWVDLCWLLWRFGRGCYSGDWRSLTELSFSLSLDDKHPCIVNQPFLLVRIRSLDHYCVSFWSGHLSRTLRVDGVSGDRRSLTELRSWLVQASLEALCRYLFGARVVTLFFGVYFFKDKRFAIHCTGRGHLSTLFEGELSRVLQILELLFGQHPFWLCSIGGGCRFHLFC